MFGGQDGTTVWTGSAFNCTSREISLFHSDYGSTAEGTAYGECGNIWGQSVKTINGNVTSSERGYVSQLIIRVRLDTFGKNIECQYDDGHSSKLVGQATVTATTGNNSLDNFMGMCNDFKINVNTQLHFPRLKGCI